MKSAKAASVYAKALFEMGTLTEDQLTRFVSLLVKYGRVKDVPEILEGYRKRILESSNILEVTVRAAIPLEAIQLEKLRNKIEKLYSQKVEMKVIKDSSISGGAVLNIGNKRLDYSVNGRLEKLRKELCN